MELKPKEYTIDGVPVRIEVSQNDDFSMAWDAFIYGYPAVLLRCFNASHFCLYMREGDEAQKHYDYSNPIDAVNALTGEIRTQIRMYKKIVASAHEVDTLLDELGQRSRLIATAARHLVEQGA